MTPPGERKNRYACSVCGRVLVGDTCRIHPGSEQLDLAFADDAEDAAALRGIRTDRWRRGARFAAVVLCIFATQAVLYDGDTLEVPLLYEGGPALWVVAVGLAVAASVALLAQDFGWIFAKDRQAWGAAEERSEPAEEGTALLAAPAGQSGSAGPGDRNKQPRVERQKASQAERRQRS